VFDGTYTRTLEEWEDGFRRDTTPWREMAICDMWAGAVERLTAHLTGDDELAREKRADAGSWAIQMTAGTTAIKVSSSSALRTYPVNRSI